MCSVFFTTKTVVVLFILVAFTWTPSFIFIDILDLWMEELRETFVDTNLLNEEISGFPCE